MPRSRTAPIDFAVVELPRGSTLHGALATELASLDDAELIHILDVVVVERDGDGNLATFEVGDLGDLGDLTELVAGFEEVLTAADVVNLAEPIAADRMAAIVVWERTWSEALVALAQEQGGDVVASGCVTVRSPDGLGTATGGGRRRHGGATGAAGPEGAP